MYIYIYVYMVYTYIHTLHYMITYIQCILYIYTPGQQYFLLSFPTPFPHRPLPQKLGRGPRITFVPVTNFKATSKFDPPRRPREMALGIIALIRKEIYIALF